ncbi:hypothetical protein PTKIN_Ptkin01aG0026800 [Pterospermum kingtungense]
MAVKSNQVIPQDTVLDILSSLPVKSLVRFQSVSKEWLSYISDPYFIKLHLKQSLKTRNSLNKILAESDKLLSLGFASVILDIPKELNRAEHNPVEIAGSCNGILCLLNRSQTHGSTVMWNISTGEYKVLPGEPMKPYARDDVYRRIFYGFGYDSFNDDYKLLRIVQDESLDFPQNILFTTEVKVYNLKTNSWRSCEQIPNYYLMNYWGMEYYKFVCGALHLLGTKELTRWPLRARVIIAFDVASEKHHPIELPNDMKPYDNIVLGALRDCLCAIISNSSDFKVNIWVMKDYGVKESWTIMHCLQYQSPSFAYLKLLWFDIKGEEFKDEDFPQLWENFDYDYLYPKAVICTESLVKLADQRELKKRSRRRQN